MLHWVAKVVPQPPEPPGSLGEDSKPNDPVVPEKKVALKQDKKKDAAKPEEKDVTDDSSSHAGVLTWISYGLSNALPQPAGTPKLGRANSEATDDNAESKQGVGVLDWISQGFSKVIPQPEAKLPEREPDEETEVLDVNDVPDAVPVPEVQVIEVVSDDEDAVVRPFPPSVITWIKQGIEKVVPQPEIHIHLSSDTSLKKEAPCPAVVAPAAPISPKPAEEGTKVEKQRHKVVGWIVQGIESILPQPTTKDGSDNVQNRGEALRAP